MYARLMDYMVKHKLLKKIQHVFRADYPMDTNIFNSVHSIASTIDNSTLTSGLYVDVFLVFYYLKIVLETVQQLNFADVK